jgi:hypothetical protein
MHGQRIDLEPPPFAFDTATVHYAADAKISLWVPVRMDEMYTLASGQIVSGRADYRNFRMFSVDVNTIIK